MSAVVEHVSGVAHTFVARRKPSTNSLCIADRYDEAGRGVWCLWVDSTEVGGHVPARDVPVLVRVPELDHAVLFELELLDDKVHDAAGVLGLEPGLSLGRDKPHQPSALQSVEIGTGRIETKGTLQFLDTIEHSIDLEPFLGKRGQHRTHSLGDVGHLVGQDRAEYIVHTDLLNVGLQIELGVL